MARFSEPTPKEERAWKRWVSKRPPVVRAMAEKFPPWELFRMKSTGQRVTVYSFNENGTLTANITGKFNLILFDRQVFGIDPNDLEPCEITIDGPTGTLMSSSDVHENIDELRVLVRPDLFEMGSDGIARRKDN